MAGWYYIRDGQKIDWPAASPLPSGADVFHVDFVNQFHYAIAERLHVYQLVTAGTRPFVTDSGGIIKVDVTDGDLVQVGDDAQSGSWFVRIMDRCVQLRDFMGGAYGGDLSQMPTISTGVEVASIFGGLRDYVSSFRSVFTQQSVGVRASPPLGSVIVGSPDQKSNPDWPIIRRNTVSRGIPRRTPYYWIYEHLGFQEIRPGVFEEVINQTTWEEVWTWMIDNQIPNPRWGPEEDPGDEPVHGYIMVGTVPRYNDYNYLQSWQGYSDNVVIQSKQTQRPDRNASLSMTGLSQTRGETGPITAPYDRNLKEIAVGRLGKEGDYSAIPQTLPEGAASFVLEWPPQASLKPSRIFQTNATWTFDFHYQ